jgi:hypothetical protein
MNDIFIRWDKLAANIRPYLADMPQATADHSRFDALLTRIRTSFHEQEVHTRRIAELIRLRKDDMVEARDLRNRLTAQLQGRFGLDSERLLEFAIKPRKRAARRKVKDDQAPLPEPTTSLD